MPYDPNELPNSEYDRLFPHSKERMNKFGYNMYIDLESEILEIIEKHKNLFKPGVLEDKEALLRIKTAIFQFLIHQLMSLSMNPIHPEMAEDFCDIISRYTKKIVRKGIAEVNNNTNGRE